MGTSNILKGKSAIAKIKGLVKLFLPTILFQFILNQALTNKKVISSFSKRLRRFILRYYDPIVYFNCNGKHIVINLSHELPFYLNLFPIYANNLTRLTSFIRNNFGGLKMIDVGANIGDSYCLSNPQYGDKYLLMEGDPHYFNLLTRNTLYNKLVTCIQVLLSDKISSCSETLLQKGGTARIVKGGMSKKIFNYQTLDGVIEKYQVFRESNFLKIDTDGYDCKVICGGLNYIAFEKPIIFFEHHPRLLALVNEDDLYIFDILSNMGYNRFIFYDNKGHWLGVVPADNTALIKYLVQYGKMLSGYCYDICCFNDKHNDLCDLFIKEENEFYKTFIASST